MAPLPATAALMLAGLLCAVAQQSFVPDSQEPANSDFAASDNSTSAQQLDTSSGASTAPSYGLAPQFQSQGPSGECHLPPDPSLPSPGPACYTDWHTEPEPHR